MLQKHRDGWQAVQQMGESKSLVPHGARLSTQNNHLLPSHWWMSPNPNCHVCQICSMHLDKNTSAHWRSVHLQHLRARGSSYPGDQRVHLHQNLYSPKPPLGYKHTCTHVQFPVQISTNWRAVETWILRASPGAGNHEDVSTVLVRRRTSAPAPCVPCRGSCWPQGTVPNQIYLEVSPFPLAVAEGVGRRLFKVCSTFSVFAFPQPLSELWDESCELSSQSLISVFPTKTLFYRK